MSEKRPVDRCNEAVTYTTEAAELAEYLQERVGRDSLDPQFDALIDLIDEAHGEAFEAEIELEGCTCGPNQACHVCGGDDE